MICPNSPHCLLFLQLSTIFEYSILGWTWYGGTRFRDGFERSEYGDYYSCANVQIRGGDEIEDEHKPVYIPGMRDASIKKCMSSVDRMGVCTNEPCKRDGNQFQAFETTPHCFNEDTLEFESSYRIRSKDVVSAQSGELQFVDPCDGKQSEPQPAGSKSNSSEVSDREDSGIDGNATEKPSGTTLGKSVSSSDGVPKIQAIKLLDSKLKEIKNYDFQGPTNVAPYLDSMTLRVDVDNAGHVDVVKFYIDDEFEHAEGNAPFYIAGKTGEQAWPWMAPLNTQFTLRIDVEHKGKVVDSWTLTPEFVTF